MRAFWVVLALACALVLGQHAAALHELGHAVDRLSKSGQETAPAESKCDQCSAYAQLAAAVGSAKVVLPALVPAAEVARRIVVSGTPRKAYPHFRSRAPPIFLA